ncbi:GGDEF domain-containing protein [Simiduia sp. 21SJ11W-1]|uniref:GGDEF domain-containing protein n=1 Tax=Simiduia sp. 21SJ11W-1 TaxID=2909669 RepID=UPI00209EF3EE|nr:GGDEF domain-containing protein [Simiduia sp. 21SJ11W-1]UTA48907.1 GGDEF domain-containing protein [Simiduia sp. 21SJ11W-1]
MAQAPDPVTCPKPECPAADAQCPLIAELTQLRQLARTDGLTQLFNQRHFRDALAQEMERTQRSYNPTSLMFIDLDFFKKVNDTHGHEAGNAALVHLAQLLKDNLRMLDVAARYGGEEFVVILPGTDLFTGRFVAERLRKKIESSPVPLPTGPLVITASIGIDTYRHTDTDSAETFIARTDKLVYKAKAQGRNCVVHGVADLRTEAQISADEKAALSDAFRSDDK